MPQSLARIVLHITFSTKHRTSFLKDADVRASLHAYMAVILQETDCEPILINGTDDHVHILFNFSRTITVAGLIESVKTTPSKWMKDQGPNCEGFNWQRGCGAFSVSQSKVEEARRYIANQEEHHRHVTFQEEFRELCRKHGIQIDERYVWDLSAGRVCCCAPLGLGTSRVAYPGLRSFLASTWAGLCRAFGPEAGWRRAVGLV